MIHVIQPRGFLLGLIDGEIRVHANIYEALPPRDYIKIKST